MKICTKCKIELPLDNFSKAKNHKDGLQYVCKACTKIVSSTYRATHADILKLKEKKWRLDNPEKEKSRSVSYKFKNPNKYLYSRTKSRSKRLGIPFNLQLEDVNIPSVCPVLGIPLFFGDGKLSNNSPSIDKKIPELGYIKGNIDIISMRANIIKSNATPEELLKIYEYSLRRT